MRTRANVSDCVWTVRKARAADFGATAVVLARAFADNPSYAYMHPRVRSRPRDLERFFLRNLAWHEAFDLTWIVADEAGRIVGTATLELPGGIKRPTLEGISHWLVPTVREQGVRTFVRTVRTAGEFHRQYEAMVGPDYWHVHAVAVDPDRQGLGAGATLLRHAFDELDRLLLSQPAPVVLSTQRERNLAFYERFGFQPVKSELMGGGSFRSWFMKRASP
jgi:ribosomal protein S18 acetylase RimI-like enzyme